MTIPEAALQIDFKTRTVARRGVVLEALPGGGGTSVRWSDGSTETVSTRERLTRTPEGSLTHLQWTDRDRRATLAKVDPAEFIGRVLRGHPRGMTIAALKKEASEGGVDGAWLSAELNSTLDRLVEDGLAVRHAKRIQPDGILSPDIRELLDEVDSAEADDIGEQHGTDYKSTPIQGPEATPRHEPDTADVESLDAEPVDRDEAASTLSGTAPSKRAKLLDPKRVAAGFVDVVGLPGEQRKSRVDELLVDEVDPYARYMGDLLAGDSTPSGLQALKNAPLDFVKFISGLPAVVVAEAESNANHPLARALLTAYPHDTKAIVAPTTVATGGDSKFVVAVEVVIGQLIPATRASTTQVTAKAALRHLVKRTAPVLIDDARLPVLVSILDAGATAIAKPDDREALLKNIATLVPTHWLNLDNAGRRQLARGAARFNLRESRGRQELVASVFRADRAAAATDIWWQGVSLIDLLESGNVLAQVLEDEAVAAAQIRPILDVAIAEVSTRKDLFQILGGSRPVVELLSPAQVSAAFDRVSRQDNALERWAGEITHSVEREALRSEIERLISVVATAESTSARAQAEITALRSRVEKAEAAAMALRSGQRDLRGAEERQLKIDAMRTLSRLLRLIDSSRIEGIAQLRTRAALLAGREDIGPIGEHGSLTTFDPRSHTSVETDLSPGDAVLVRAPGYVWAHGTERIVLLRADVERQASEEHE